MNKSKIDWTEYTWNPVTGCKRGCRYCYAKKQSLRFSGDIRLNLADERCRGDKENELYVLDKPYISRKDRSLNTPFGFAPTLHTYRLDYPGQIKNGANIFVCSMADLFGPWVPDEWIQKVFESSEKWPQHNYIFLTKFPERYTELQAKGILPNGENYWYGSTVTNPSITYFSSKNTHTFLSIEPILEPFGEAVRDMVHKVDWIIIGAESGNSKGKVKPQREWVIDIVNKCLDAEIPVFLKGSLQSVMGDTYDLTPLQEYPGQLTNHPISSKLKNKLYERCGFCKVENKKKDMVALLSRKQRGAAAMILGYACPECFEKLQQSINSDEPVEVKDEKA